MTRPRIPGGKTDRLLSALATLKPGQVMTSAELSVAAGVDSPQIRALLRYSIEQGRVIVSATSPRRQTYRLGELATAAAPAPKAEPKPAQADGGCKRGPRGKTITEPWTPRLGGKPLSEPGQAARDAAIPPGVKVTVRPTPPGRYEVDPRDVPLVFSALRPGQYLEGERA
jgi:hypothetical protein